MVLAISRDSKWWVRASNRFAMISQNASKDSQDYFGGIVKARAAASIAKMLQAEGK